MDDDQDKAVQGLTQCPRCGSAEFVVEFSSYQGCHEHWCICRNCLWTLGELLHINLDVRGGSSVKTA